MRTRRTFALHWLIAAAAVFAPFAASAACTKTLTPGTGTPGTGDNLTYWVEQSAAGATICLPDGDYWSSAPAGPGGSPFPNTAFAVNQSVTIVGNSANPGNVRLHSTGSGGYAFQFVGYADAVGGLSHPNSAWVEGVTILGNAYGVLVDDYNNPGVRLTDITLKNVVVNPGTNDGILAGGVTGTGPQRLTMDNVTVSAPGIGFNLRNTIDSVLINSTVNSPNGTYALFVNGGKNNTFAGNTFGLAPSATGFTLAASGVDIVNSQSNRFEMNTVQGHQSNGVTVYNSGSGGLDTSLQASDNYLGKNSVISNGFVAGRGAGTGMWVNCGANQTVLFGNDAYGGPEAALTIWSSRNNAVIGNKAHNNQHAGMFVSGGTDVYSDCNVLTYQQKGQYNTLQSNAVYFNKNDNIVVRNADYTDVTLNHISPRNGFGGSLQACANTGCQSGLDFEGTLTTVVGSRALRNTSIDNARGLWIADGNTVGLQMFGNRFVTGSYVNNPFNEMVPPSSNSTLDGGSALGGNYWSGFAANGNPGTTPYTNINTGSAPSGYASDRYPYLSESFAISTMTVSEPLAGTYAIGSQRTVRWNALGCSWVDLSLVSGATTLAALQTNYPNTGYAVVTLPSVTAGGPYNVKVACRNAAGTLTGAAASSPGFTVVSNSIQLLAPGRDAVYNAGDVIPIAWKRNGGFTGAVSIALSTDGGTSFSQPAGWGLTYTGDIAYLTLPAIASNAYARVRILASGTAIDMTDGVFAIRGSSGAGFTSTNFPSARAFGVGRLERLEWASPQNSRLVTITYTGVNGSGTVVTNFPDRGSYDWIVPDVGAGALSFSIKFMTGAGATISTVTSPSASANYPNLTGPFNLSVNPAGSGTVTSTPAGISCPPTCDATFTGGTAVTLTPTPGAGATFFGWSGDCTGTTCTVSMTTSRSVAAEFYSGAALAVRYRLYSSGTLEHLYTTDLNEYNVLPVCCAWSPEGAIYKVMNGAGSFGGVTAVPYLRLYNPLSYQHHWTTDLNEYNALPGFGWQQEGIDGYVLPSQAPGTLPLYRLYINAAGGLHLWTTDYNEMTVLTTSNGWIYEGVAGYVIPLNP